MTNGNTSADRRRLENFEALIVDTIGTLERVSTPSAFGASLEPLVERWDTYDREFAALLREIKTKAWQMELDHLRAVSAKFRNHLEANLADVRQQLKGL